MPFNAGSTEWKTFWKVTLPNIKWGLLYGVLLLNTVCGALL